MRTQDFDYMLPSGQIAQYPLEKRDKCRLLCLDRKNGGFVDREFCELPDLLLPGDRLVFNDTKVVPARLFCQKITGGKVELLFLEPTGTMAWKVLVRPGRGLSTGTELFMAGDPSIRIHITAVNADGSRDVLLEKDGTGITMSEVIKQYGVMALPHYIRRPAEDQDRDTYQTVYARREGAIASPTAGLHFTHELIKALLARRIDISYVTLHVGVGTFKPVTEDDPRNHVMHEETYELTQQTASEIAATKKRGGRIIAVGTTAVRVLEHCAAQDGAIKASSGKTKLMILPGYQFKAIDGMVTNFHVPKSTLLMLVSAFAGRGPVLAAYGHAVLAGYRFFSYGDAMFIL
jgi:S-adenosylmethionine:tRNA ribosyltransferase-isomerase